MALLILDQKNNASSYMANAGRLYDPAMEGEALLIDDWMKLKVTSLRMINVDCNPLLTINAQSNPH